MKGMRKMKSGIQTAKSIKPVGHENQGSHGRCIRSLRCRHSLGTLRIQGERDKRRNRWSSDEQLCRSHPSSPKAVRSKRSHKNTHTEEAESNISHTSYIDGSLTLTIVPACCRTRAARWQAARICRMLSLSCICRSGHTSGRPSVPT
jgi:hypothetical protein